MNKKLSFLLSEFAAITPAMSKRVIAEVQKEAGFEFPVDYVEVMREMNGGEGEIGENCWLNLWQIEKLIDINRKYDYLMKGIPDYFLFGKDSADTGYAFHKKEKTINEFGLLSSFPRDRIKMIGYSFAEFLEYLYNT
jgi:hypothetical protein